MVSVHKHVLDSFRLLACVSIALATILFGEPLWARYPDNGGGGGNGYCCRANNGSSCCGCSCTQYPFAQQTIVVCIQLPNIGESTCDYIGNSNYGCTSDVDVCASGEFVPKYSLSVGTGCASTCRNQTGTTSFTKDAALCDPEATECPL